MSPDHDELRRLLGGYLLGGLDDADTDRLDAHLLHCDGCREELERLGPVPELLRSLTNAPPLVVAPGTRPSPARVEGLLGRMRAERARERRRAGIRWLAAAAVVLLAAVSLGIVLTRDRDAPVPPQAAASHPPLVTAEFEAADGSGMAGQAVLTGKTWGVSVDLTVSKLSGRGPFVCQVRRADGMTEQAAIWGPTPSGNARVTGASSIQLPSVSVVAVADKEGHVLGTARVR
ncbi:zf-HC2 domain-containing protein [Couchioplanes caeruleus]|uniref:zf-HC2 domain-containing protein n=1 Tax=Couchioplanes caeruleus TaxID=56438 RepID=UPI0020BFEC88|nr:zf-HC2 domain-containing protein [Couchioplanes caeruleus]UQU64530.1 zf-HC2 domain-containing protein [Couchioplanes caeruleus]